VKTGGRIHNITEKNAERDLLYVQPTIPDFGKPLKCHISPLHNSSTNFDEI